MASRIAALFAFAFATLASSSALALWPDNGWYWNPNESGRGVSVEVQNDKIFIAIYVYESTGAPIWYYAAGAMTDDHTFTNTLYKTSNGQCIGCSPRTPVSTPVGTVTMTFTSFETATLTALG